MTKGKELLKHYFMTFIGNNGLDIRVARIFNTYGPNMAINDGRVISNFIVQAIKKDSITIYGDGSQTRSFCYVDDLVDGLVKLMFYSNAISPVNLGNPQELDIKYLAEEICKLTNNNSNIKYLSLPEGDPVRRKPDITVAKTLLNWQPEINLESGLIKTINFFKNSINKR